MKKLGLSGIALGFAAMLSAGTALADIMVSTVGPVSGQLAALGEQYSQGAKKAVADINAAGGVNGEKLVLEIGDDACDPKQAVNVANQMASKGVKFVAGHLCSGSSIPASKVYEEEGILMISPASTNPKFTDEGGWNVARVCGRDDAQGRVAGAYLAKNFAGKKVAIVHDKSAYGKGLADLTKENMNANGLKEVLYEGITAGEQDYTALVSKLKQTGVDAIYFGGYHPEAALIVRQSREQGLKAPLLSGDSLNTLEFATLAGKAADGTMFTNAAEARNLPTAKKAVEEFRAEGFEPEGYTLSTYAAIQVWAQAVEKVGAADDAEKIAETIRSGSWDTVIGKLSFDKKGDLTSSAYVWYVFKDGNYTEM
jgi:branched-chain amino acid transport system substrate-binding protein